MIICVCGPTGTGKSDLSLKLAKKYNAVIINADATQIYTELNIGSAKISDSALNEVKHYMINIKKPTEDFSVSEYQSMARKYLDENKNVIVVGGTGLYIKALFNNYEFSKRTINNTYDDLSNEKLYELVLKKDKNTKIHMNNRIRMINFLNNKKTSHNGNEKLYDVIYIGLTLDRDKLYKKTDNRVDNMIKIGLIDEVKTLYKKYPNSNILKRAIGYKEIISYLDNEITLDDAINKIKQNTRHYIKRQYTWFNNQENITWFDTDNKNFYEDIISYIESLNSK